VLAGQVIEVSETGLFERERLAIEYASSLKGKVDLPDYDSLVTERLSLGVEAELAAGYALVGPHRDDLELTFDGRDVRK